MAIKSHPFGRTRLSGQEAAEFRRQIEQRQPNPALQSALENGRKMLEEYSRQGFVVIKLSR